MFYSADTTRNPKPFGFWASKRKDTPAITEARIALAVARASKRTSAIQKAAAMLEFQIKNKDTIEAARKVAANAAAVAAAVAVEKAKAKADRAKARRAAAKKVQGGG